MVREFANLLIRCGLDVRLDQFAGPGRKDWLLWATDNIDNADFVILIASPRCLAVGEGKADRNENPGMHCELGIIRDRLQANRKLWEQKLLPVVLPGESLNNIPVFLQPQAMDRYEIDEPRALCRTCGTLRSSPRSWWDRLLGQGPLAASHGSSRRVVQASAAGSRWLSLSNWTPGDPQHIVTLVAAGLPVVASAANPVAPCPKARRTPITSTRTEVR